MRKSFALIDIWAILQVDVNIRVGVVPGGTGWIIRLSLRYIFCALNDTKLKQSVVLFSQNEILEDVMSKVVGLMENI